MSLLYRTHCTLVALTIGWLALGVPALAQSEAHLIYPQPWCDEAAKPLYFTMDQLGISQAVLTDEPSHGYVGYLSTMAEVGIYIPRCEGLLGAGFDVFQLTSGDSGELVSVIVLLSDGDSEGHQVQEEAYAGVLGNAWELVHEGHEGSGSDSGVEIVEWPDADVPLLGTHGFQADFGDLSNSYIRFKFDGSVDAYQPSNPNGDENNGVATTIIIRPPTVPPPYNLPDGEQLIYATGYFDGGAPGTALRLWSDGGDYWIRAEAGQTGGSTDTVFTAGCPLNAGVTQRVTVTHNHGIDGQNDLLKLQVGPVDSDLDCVRTRNEFVTAHPPAREHRFGFMDRENGGLAFDFDRIKIASFRYEAQLSPDLLDDFEHGRWNQQWTPISPGSLSVIPRAAHTGFQGLEIQPIAGDPSYLKRKLPRTVSDFGCHLSLSGQTRFLAQSSPVSRARAFAARGTGGDEVRLWVRKLGVEYQLRAHSGSRSTTWLRLAELPATLDLRWTRGHLQLWIDGCGPNPESCGIGHSVEEATQDRVTKVLFGDVAVTGNMEPFTVDNVVCVIEPAPTLSQ